MSENTTNTGTEHVTDGILEKRSFPIDQQRNLPAERACGMCFPSAPIRVHFRKRPTHFRLGAASDGDPVSSTVPAPNEKMKRESPTIQTPAATHAFASEVAESDLDGLHVSVRVKIEEVGVKGGAGWAGRGGVVGWGCVEACCWRVGLPVCIRVEIEEVGCEGRGWVGGDGWVVREWTGREVGGLCVSARKRTR